MGYPGTLILVSHDRAFLDNVVTQTLAAEGDGRWKEYVGGYTDWVAQRAVPARSARAGEPQGAAVASGTGRSGNAAAAGLGAGSAGTRARLGFKEARELQELPAQIEALEQERVALHAAMGSGDYHRQGPQRLKSDTARLAAIERQHAEKFARWVALEERRNTDA
jgi:ATP-binding cassette subfamily F protein uup